MPLACPARLCGCFRHGRLPPGSAAQTASRLPPTCLPRLNLTSATWPTLAHIFDEAGSLLSADAVEARRRC